LLWREHNTFQEVVKIIFSSKLKNTVNGPVHFPNEGQTTIFPIEVKQKFANSKISKSRKMAIDVAR
jgi:hypothetical protein